MRGREVVDLRQEPGSRLLPAPADLWRRGACIRNAPSICFHGGWKLDRQAGRRSRRRRALPLGCASSSDACSGRPWDKRWTWGTLAGALWRTVEVPGVVYPVIIRARRIGRTTLFLLSLHPTASQGSARAIPGNLGSAATPATARVFLVEPLRRPGFFSRSTSCHDPPVTAASRRAVKRTEAQRGPARTAGVLPRLSS